MAVRDQQHSSDEKSAARRRPDAQPVRREELTLGEQAIPAVLQRTVASPRLVTPGDVQTLQGVVGNRAVTGLLARSPSRLPIQAKLTVNAPGDEYEHQADAVAGQVMSTMGQPSAVSRQPLAQRQEEEELQAKSLVQRQEEEEKVQPKSALQRQEDEEELQAKPASTLITPAVQRQEEEELQAKSLVQRQEEEEEVQPKSALQRQEDEEELQAKPLAQRQEEEEEVQPKSALQRQEEEEQVQMQPGKGIQRLPGDGGMVVAPGVESAIRNARGGGQPLSGEVRDPMERAFGAAFGEVRVHTDSEAHTLSQSLQARAFTTGQDIFFGSGEYSPGSSSGQQLLAHELTHTRQQVKSDRISRWGGPGNTTHKEVTRAAIDTSPDPQVRRIFTSPGIQKYVAEFAENMDLRDACRPGVGAVIDWLQQKVLGWERKETRKLKKTMGGEKSGPVYEMKKADWESIKGYARDAEEAVNHAETGQYKQGVTVGAVAPRTRQRIDTWMSNAEIEALRGKWNEAFMFLGLALHTAEDIGSHGHGVPGKGHDPRRFIPPPVPPVGKRPPVGAGYWRGYGAKFTDCDQKDKNPAGYKLAVAQAWKLLSRFARYVARRRLEVRPRMRLGGKSLRRPDYWWTRFTKKNPHWWRVKKNRDLWYYFHRRR